MIPRWPWVLARLSSGRTGGGTGGGGGALQSPYVDFLHAHVVPSIIPWNSAYMHGLLLQREQHILHLASNVAENSSNPACEGCTLGPESGARPLSRTADSAWPAAPPNPGATLNIFRARPTSVPSKTYREARQMAWNDVVATAAKGFVCQRKVFPGKTCRDVS